MRASYLGCWVIVMVAVNGHAQSSLHDFSKTRSAHFVDQQSKVQAYSAFRQQPISFVDDKGITIFMMGLSPGGIPIYLTTLNALAAVTTNVVQLRAGGAVGLDLQGKGMLIGVWDGG